MSPHPRAAHAVDVLVIGAGGAGLSSAVAAAQAGARVLVLEKKASTGGTSALAVGSISAAVTRKQAQAGIVDQVQDFHEDMDLFTGDLLPRDNAELRAMLARQAGPTVDWLETMGVTFAGPFAEPPHRRERMHNAIPGARAIIDRLLRMARRLGVQVQCQAQVRELLVDAQAGVNGVRYEYQGHSRELRVNGGVILASGDFSGNAQMRQAHLPQAAARAMPINPDNAGDGFALAAPLGAAHVNMDAIFGPQLRFARGQRRGLGELMPAWPWLTRLAAWAFGHAPKWMLRPLISRLLVVHMSPSDQLFKAGAVLLDSHGEALDTHQPAHAVAATQDRTGFIVLAAPLASACDSAAMSISTAPGIGYAFLADYARARPDLVHRAADLTALARQLGMDPENLLRNPALRAAGAGPWVALGPVHAMLTTTEGALATDSRCRVLDQDGQPIRGLFAAGCIGQGGLLLRGHGLHLAWVFSSGRISGQSAAEAAKAVWL
jgi:fumarate reductase flavoprotein subunit